MRKISKEKPDLVLFLGDHTMEGTSPAAWRQFYHLVGKFARNTPLLGVPGNHDTKLSRGGGARHVLDAYKTYVNYPEPKERYFLQIYGIQLFAFDFESDFTERSKNCTIFNKHIQNIDEAIWTIAMWHSSPHNTVVANEMTINLRKNIIPKLNEKGCRLWLGGHEHSYQKFKVNDTYFITSAATSSFHKHRSNLEHLEKVIMKYHYTMLDIRKNLMKVQAISIGNKIIDEFEIKNKE